MNVFYGSLTTCLGQELLLIEVYHVWDTVKGTMTVS